MAFSNAKPPQVPTGDTAAAGRGTGWGAAKSDAEPGGISAEDREFAAVVVIERLAWRPTLQAKVRTLLYSPRFGSAVKGFIVRVPLLVPILASWGIVLEVRQLAREWWAAVKAKREAEAAGKPAAPAANQTIDAVVVKQSDTGAPSASGKPSA